MVYLLIYFLQEANTYSYSNFQCDDGVYIPWTYYCDHVKQCADGSDEIGCCEYLFTLYININRRCCFNVQIKTWSLKDLRTGQTKVLHVVLNNCRAVISSVQDEVGEAEDMMTRTCTFLLFNNLV